MSYEDELRDKFKKIFTHNEVAFNNKSTAYLLPMLGFTVNSFKSPQFPMTQFRSLFIGDKSHDSFDDNKLMLVYKFSGKEEFIRFESFLESLPTFKDKYEPDKFHTIYVYDIPTIWREDFDKFLQWKPSEFSKEYKQQIAKFYNIQNYSDPIMKVVYKSELLFEELENKIGCLVPRDLEASSSPYWSIEYWQKEFCKVKSFDKMKENNGD